MWKHLRFGRLNPMLKHTQACYGQKPVDFMLPNGLKEILDFDVWKDSKTDSNKLPLLSVGDFFNASERHQEVFLQVGFIFHFFCCFFLFVLLYFFLIYLCFVLSFSFAYINMRGLCRNFNCYL